MDNVEILRQEYSAIWPKFDMHFGDTYIKNVVKELSLNALEGIKDCGWHNDWKKESKKEIMRRTCSLGKVIYKD